MRRTLFVLAVIVALAVLPSHAARFVTYENITVAGTAIGFTTTTLDTADGIQMTNCEVLVKTAEVNFRFDGTAPTSSVGVTLEPGAKIQFDNHADAERARWIRTTSTSAAVQGHCWAK